MSPFLQLIVNFALPLYILSRFSGSDQLGPTKAFLLALAIPVLFEAYSVYKKRRFSVLSALAIGGILVTGAVSLLGLSEGWLAVRRGLPYIAAGAALVISIWIDKPLLRMAAPRILDMQAVQARLSDKAKQLNFERIVQRAGYTFGILFILAGIATYIVTRVVIVSPSDTAAFNQEYARLRVLTLPAISLPLFVAAFGIIFQLVRSIERLTGLCFENVFKKKPL